VALFRKRQRPGTMRTGSSADERHLEEFARTRRGVEAYVEPRTAVTETTVLLIADTGEWTRRRVSGPKAAHALAYRLGIPAYDAGVVGYPQRMRDWNRRQAEARRRPSADGGDATNPP
jgi:hypothetical protein